MTSKVSHGPWIQPAEWVPHEAVWLAWPSHGELWEENLKPAQAEFSALCRAIADVDPATRLPRGERLEILVPHTQARKDAEEALKGLGARFHEVPFGDIWLRDTAPIFVRSQVDGRLAPASFGFNGWGGKYALPHDPEVSLNVARASGLEGPAFRDFILEGGSIEADGEGTCLTTRQCLLNENRNPGLTQTQIEQKLAASLGAKKVLWLGDGLINDHTDGHVDTVARLIAPGVAMCMKPSGTDDPNAEALEQIARDLRSFTDARGRKLRVVEVPSPGAVLNEEGELMAASFVNFYIGNTTVVVPVYGTPYDDAAVAAIAAEFPGRRSVGLSAKAILSGGGAFHCISQQQPNALASASVSEGVPS
jgi:agmatine deiminase